MILGLRLWSLVGFLKVGCSAVDFLGVGVIYYRYCDRRGFLCWSARMGCFGRGCIL